jgi:hypothetical protein
MKARKPGVDGYIRQADGSLNHVGIQAGDLLIIDLKSPPKQDELCAAFTAAGELLIRFFHRERDGSIRLTTRRRVRTLQLFAPSAVVVFGCVREIVKAAVAA